MSQRSIPSSKLKPRTTDDFRSRQEEGNVGKTSMLTSECPETETPPASSQVRRRCPSDKCTFFELPGELREHILQFACLDPGGIGVGCRDGDKDFAFPQDLVPARPPLGVFLACTQLYREAAAVYYSQNTFHIDCSIGRASALLLPVRQLLGAAPPSPDFFYPGHDSGSGSGSTSGKNSTAKHDPPSDMPPARLRIRSVVLYVRRFGSSVASVAVPALREMVLRGTLRKLQVRVRPTRSAEGGGHWPASLSPPDHARLRRNAPFQDLLGLLADPDLQVARLWVARAHWSAWCHFHIWREGDAREATRRLGRGGVNGDDNSSGGGGTVCPACVRGFGRSRRRDEYFELDLPKLSRTCGAGQAELRILKVGDEFRRASPNTHLMINTAT